MVISLIQIDCFLECLYTEKKEQDITESLPTGQLGSEILPGAISTDAYIEIKS